MVQINWTLTILSLRDLTIKTTMLLALTRPCRGADLAALELTNRKYIPEGVVFSPSRLSKQSIPSHHGVEFSSLILKMKSYCVQSKL